MFCDICGRELEEGARFCDVCGRRLTIEEQPWRHTTSPDLVLPGARPIQQPVLRTISFRFPEALSCSICGRVLEAVARFCDVCGRRLTIEEQPWRHTTPQYLMRPSVAEIQQPIPRAIPAHEVTLATTGESTRKTVESKPLDSRYPEPAPRQRRPALHRGPRFSRRLIVLSAIGLAAVAIIVVSLVAFPILSGGTTPFWQGTTSSRTVATSTTSRGLSVQINIARDPVTLGGVQTVTVTVLDPDGQPVPQAQVHLEVTYPSGQVPVQRDGETDTSGLFRATWQIIAVHENVGAYQVRVSATMAGYQTGQAEAAFQVTEAAP